MLLLLLSRFSRVRLYATPETAVHQAPHPWDSPGKNTGVGCHFLLQCMKVKSCLTPSDPMDCSMPGSPVLHYLPEVAQIHVHRVNDGKQPSHPLLPSSPFPFNLSQPQGLAQ